MGAAVVVAALLGASSAQASNPPSGLVGAWAFEERRGDSALDSSGHRNTGTIMGATRTQSGRFGRGMSFDGQDDWITIADHASLDLTEGMTLEAWVKPDAIDATWRTVVLKEQPEQLVYALYASTDKGTPSGNVFNTFDNGVAAPEPLQIGRWTHFAATYDNSMVRVYLDGVEVASQEVPGPIKLSDGALRIGGNSVWGEWFDGEIDEVRVYNRALSADEIAADRDRPIGQGNGNAMSPLEKLKALVMRLLARWREHWGNWSWDGHFRGGR